MFTGLVQDIGTVAQIDRGADGARLWIRSPLVAGLREGDSVAVNGVCLTATALGEELFGADVMVESLRRSSLGALAPGARVNLELAVRAGEPLGGHLVQGHVDGVGEVQAVRDEGFARLLIVAAPPELLRYVVEKGSVALDGVSLTAVDVGERAFAVSLIPETRQRTTLGAAARGTVVNVEVDVLAKYVEKLGRR